MSFSNRDDADLLARSQKDLNDNALGMVGRRMRHDVRPTFDEAYRRMSAEGKPGLFILKTGSVALGSFMMADGLYHVLAGNDERVEDLFLNTPNNRNYTRMFAGGCEMAAGALLAYLGATKGPAK